MAAGSIVVDLLMRTGSFETDTQRAGKALSKMKKEALETGRALGDSLRNLAAAAGVGLSIAGITAFVKGAIDAADRLNDLSKKTGIAVETLGGIGFAAQQAGGDLESVAAAAGKLNKTLAEAAAGNKESAEVFSVLGVSVTDVAGKTRKADEVMADLADRFAEFEDGPEKAAIALKVFGKAGADIIPLLNEGGKSLRDNIEYYRRFAGVTTETAAQADQFNDTLGKINLISGAFGRTLAAELLPALQAIADEFLSAKEKSSAFSDSAGAVRGVFEALTILAANVVFVFKGVGTEIGAIGAQLAALGQLDFKGFSAIREAVVDDAKRARAELDALEQRILGFNKIGAAEPFFSVDATQAAAAKKQAPRLPSSDSDAELKKELDGRIRLIRDFADQQRDAYKFAQEYVRAVFDEGLIQLRDKFDEEKRLRAAALRATTDALDAEAAELAKRAKVTKGPERQELDNRIAEARSKRAAAVAKAAQDEVLAEQRARVETVAELKRALDDRVRIIRDAAEDQREAVRFAESYVAGAYDEGLISLRARFAEERRLREAHLAEITTALDREIQELQIFSGQAQGTAREDAEKRIEEAMKRRADAVTRAGRDGVIAAQRERAEVKALEDGYQELLARVADLRGDESASAAIRNARQVSGARELVQRRGGDQGVVEEFGRRLEATSQLSQVQREYNTLLEQARVNEERIALAARESGASEIETLGQVREAREESLRQLSALAFRAAEVAEALGTPEARLFADQLANAFRRAALEVDPLLEKIRDAADETGKALANNLGEAIKQGKSLRETLQGIAEDLLAITTRKLITEPLGASLSQSLGGSGNDSGLFGSLLSAFASSYTGQTIDTSGAGTTVPADDRPRGGRATGGEVLAGGAYQVGERGPEIFVPSTSGKIIPNTSRKAWSESNSGSGMRTWAPTINIAVPPGTSEQTANQIGVRVAQRLRAASIRNA